MSEQEANGDDLTPDERAAFAALPRERVPPAHLEERVVQALRRRRLLGERRRIAGRPWAWAAAAAGIALFSAGTATGQWLAARSTVRAVSAVIEAGTGERAARVQEAGSAYVRAVADLAGMGAASGEADSGVEAARVALHAAALELARVRPDDPTIRLVLAVLEERAREAGTDRPSARTTFWF